MHKPQGKIKIKIKKTRGKKEKKSLFCMAQKEKKREKKEERKKRRKKVCSDSGEPDRKKTGRSWVPAANLTVSAAHCSICGGGTNTSPPTSPPARRPHVCMRAFYPILSAHPSSSTHTLTRIRSTAADRPPPAHTIRFVLLLPAAAAASCVLWATLGAGIHKKKKSGKKVGKKK